MSSLVPDFDPNNPPNSYCLPWQDIPASPYSYRPSLAAGVIFIILFGSSAVIHTIVSIRARRWWQLTFTIGAVAELIGWSGRTWSSQCPYQSTPFLIQISTLIFAPAFFTGGTYIILGRLIKLFGPETSPLKPNTYFFIFFAIDTASLIIQATGGGLAASALNDPGNSTAATGTNAMIGGIVFQMASVLVFSSLAFYVINNARKLRVPALQERRVRFIILATLFSVVCVVIRSIYRTIEMLQGWSGYLITTERYFIVLDGSLMAAAVIVFNLVNPGYSEGATTYFGRSPETIIEEKETTERDAVLAVEPELQV